MIGIDLFSGAGGLSLGAIQAGINVEYAVELDTKAALTCLSNHSDLKMLNKDITITTADDFSSSISKKNDLILFGGPPCQGFSTSNQRSRNKNNLNNWLFKEFIRLAQELEPAWIVIENVKGLLETENKLFYEKIINDLTHLGYKTSPFLLNAVDYGVPQNRTRLFIIGSKKFKKIQEPTKKNKRITVSEALLDLPDIENGNHINALPYRMTPHSEYSKLMRDHALDLVYNNLVTKSSHQVIERYSHIPQGGNWQDIPEELMGNYKDRTRCHTGIYKRLIASDPSITIGNFRKSMIINPWKNRGLSVREAARIQSFPDNFIFHGSIGFQQQQVGNAVPPLLAKAVFQRILQMV